MDVERLTTRPSIPSSWALHSAARSLIGALTEGDRVRRRQNLLIMGMTVDWDRSVGVSQSHGSMAAALIVTLAARDFLRLAIAASLLLDRSRARLRGSQLLARSLSCNHPRIRYARSAYVTVLDLRISAIVDAHFSLIVDGETALRRTRRGGAQALGLNVAQSSTISLKRSAVEPAVGLVVGLI